MKTDTNQIPLILYENDIQEYCERCLVDRNIPFFHVPDSFWRWVYKNTSTGIRCWLFKVFGSLPDMMIFFPINDRFSLMVNVELKKPGGYLRTGQKEAAEKMPWVTAKSPDAIEQIINEAQCLIERIKAV